jgi:hypothetical protein
LHLGHYHERVIGNPVRFGILAAEPGDVVLPVAIDQRV